MPKRICPICKLKVSQYAYGIGIPEGGSGWYFGGHYPVVGGPQCIASREDVAIVAAKVKEAVEHGLAADKAFTCRECGQSHNWHLPGCSKVSPSLAAKA